MKCKFCRKKGSAYIRGFEMCNIHYSILKRDNIYRFKIGDSTSSFKIYRSCETYICTNRFISNIKQKYSDKRYCDSCLKKRLSKL